MELTVLTVPDCRNAPVLEERLAKVLADWPQVTVLRRVIDDADQAARWGMRGSPTLLIDGRDLFADPTLPTSVSCRIYRDSHGRVQGAPTLDALRTALKQSGTAR